MKGSMKCIIVVIVSQCVLMASSLSFWSTPTQKTAGHNIRARQPSFLNARDTLAQVEIDHDGEAYAETDEIDLKKSSSSGVENENDKKPKIKTKKRMTEVKFVGTKVVVSLPVEMPPKILKNKSLNDFFGIDQHRNVLLAEKPDLVQINTNPTPELLERWSQECILGGGGPVDFDDTHDGSNTNEESMKQVLQFDSFLYPPALKIISATTVGCKLYLPITNTGRLTKDVAPSASTQKMPPLPKYEFTVIDSTQTAVGPKPLVWIFSQILKKGNSPTSSFTTVRAQYDLNNGDSISENGNKQIVFSTTARLEVRVNIPSLVLRFLPVSIETFEKQGSGAIQSLLDKELGPGLERFRNAYMQWITK